MALGSRSFGIGRRIETKGPAKIKKSLARHKALMDSFMAVGNMTKEQASRAAYDHMKAPPVKPKEQKILNGIADLLDAEATEMKKSDPKRRR